MEDLALSKVELKYCECCGGLWLRSQGNHHVYCSACAPGMLEMSPRKKRPVSEKNILASGGLVCA